MNREEVEKNVRRFLEDETFVIPEILDLLPEGYFDYSVDVLCDIITDFSSTLPAEALDDPELFSQCLEKYFMSNDIINFGYDGNSQRAFREGDLTNLYVEFINGLKTRTGEDADLSQIKLSGKEERILNKILSHTFFPLVNGILVKGNYGMDKQHRAICSGFAQLGCIIASCYGFECTPLAAQVFTEDRTEEEYRYAHYLVLIGKEGKTALLDPQSANTVYRTISSDEDLQSFDVERMKETALKGVDDRHARMIFIATSEKRHEAFDEFNSSRFIQGGLGANVGGLVRVVGMTPEISTCRFTLNESRSKTFVEIASKTDGVYNGGLPN